jgi:4-hydroxybenzoate polyprenyltransferase
VLGVAFSFGIPMAYLAVQGGASFELFSSTAATTATANHHRSFAVPQIAWLLLLGNLFWVLAYDTEYAMVDRDDDLKIGMKTSAITMGQWDVPIVMACYGLHLLIWTVLIGPQVHPLVWALTLSVALIQVAFHFVLIRGRTREGCFQAFRLNHWLGFTLFIGVVLGLALFQG